MGTVLAGKYRVDRVLGQGGMGLVVQAMHLQLHQPVAMKFLLPEVLGNAQIVQRFQREAQAVVRLKSEHVARVLDVGSLENGAPYMVLEYLEGTDLSHFPRQQLTIGQIIDLILQACEALAEAHSLGIVHRDIKPANFFITRAADGSLLLKVLDFGISKAQQGTLEQNLTATSVVMGTPAYMSPEHIKSTRDVDNRSDIWSLGIVLYELFQGETPFGADSFGAIAIKVATEPVPPLSTRLPPGLPEIVYRCLEKDPARRFQNVAELAHVLAPYAHTSSQAVVSVQRTSRVLRTDPGLSPSTLSSSTGAITQPPRSTRRLPWIIGTGVLVGGIAATVIAVSSGGGGGGGTTDPDSLASPAASPPAPPPPPPDREPARAPDPPDAAVAGPAALADAAIATVPPDAPPEAATQSRPPATAQKKPPKPPKPPGGQKPPPPPSGGSDDFLDNRH